MKGYSKKLLCALLAVLIAVCAMTSIGFAAAEADPASAEAEPAPEVTEVPEATAETAKEELAPVALDDPTEPPTEPPTEAPTEPTVAKVRNLDRTSFDSNRCRLDWDVVPGADGYYIYYLNADKHKNFSKVGDVHTNACIVKNLQQGTQYHFKVSAYINYNGKIIEGEAALKKTATQPAAMSGLTKWRSSNVLQMDWNRNANATGYRVYRTSTESGNKEVLYKTIYGNNNTSFSDTSVKQGRVYTYRVKSFRELYGTSYSGDAQSITFMAGLCGPDYSITSRCQRVNLTWRANAYATHYEIYYSTSPNNATFTKLFTTPRLYFNTTKLTAGKTYYFRVQPIYKKGSTTITGTSNKKSATISTKAYGYNTGSTYIEISIDQQHMWVYKNGSQIASTEVVTGNRGDCDTPKGYYSVVSKSRGVTLSGPGYSSYVEYWMAFIGSSYGIHDASWRSEFGNPIYKGNGSHGCVNTPRSSMATIYNNIPSGTPVIIY